MDGVLVIDKPKGPTSFDVVRQVRSALRVRKAGHTGTLDPMATGVLPVCLGEGTKIAGYLTEGDKAYDAVLKLGVETDTQDAEGRVLVQREVPALTASLLEGALARFRGSYAQLPPMYSAVRVAGKRLYEHARAGEDVERAPRQVTVHELILRDFSADTLRLSVRSSKGFFVRTLAHELGQVLGCGAHLTALRRTASGPFLLEAAVPLTEVPRLAADPAALAERLVSLVDALGELCTVRVSAHEEGRVLHGVPLEAPAGAQGRVRVLSPQGRLLALAEPVAGRLRYLRVFSGKGEADP